jgi:hypothetical protein
MECEERRTLKRVHELEMLIHDLVVAHGLLEGELIEKKLFAFVLKKFITFSCYRQIARFTRRGIGTAATKERNQPLGGCETSI